MVTTEISNQLSEFLYENKIDKIGFISHVGHKTNERVYGSLFVTEKGFLYVQHKWEKTPENQVPRVYAKETSKFKFVENNFFDAFELISTAQHSERWGIALEKI